MTEPLRDYSFKIVVNAFDDLFLKDNKDAKEFSNRVVGFEKGLSSAITYKKEDVDLEKYRAVLKNIKAHRKTFHSTKRQKISAIFSRSLRKADASIKRLDDLEKNLVSLTRTRSQIEGAVSREGLHRQLNAIRTDIVDQNGKINEQNFQKTFSKFELTLGEGTKARLKDLLQFPDPKLNPIKPEERDELGHYIKQHQEELGFSEKEIEGLQNGLQKSGFQDLSIGARYRIINKLPPTQRKVIDIFQNRQWDRLLPSEIKILIQLSKENRDIAQQDIQQLASTLKLSSANLQFIIQKVLKFDQKSLKTLTLTELNQTKEFLTSQQAEFQKQNRSLQNIQPLSEKIKGYESIETHHFEKDPEKTLLVLIAKQAVLEDLNNLRKVFDEDTINQTIEKLSSPEEQQKLPSISLDELPLTTLIKTAKALSIEKLSIQENLPTLAYQNDREITPLTNAIVDEALQEAVRKSERPLDNETLEKFISDKFKVVLNETTLPGMMNAEPNSFIVNFYLLNRKS